MSDVPNRIPTNYGRRRKYVPTKGFRTSDKPRNPLYSTSRWKALRMDTLAHYPYCLLCGSLASQVDHCDGYTSNNNTANLLALCQTCHSWKTNVFEKQGKRLQSVTGWRTFNDSAFELIPRFEFLPPAQHTTFPLEHDAALISLLLLSECGGHTLATELAKSYVLPMMDARNRVGIESHSDCIIAVIALTFIEVRVDLYNHVERYERYTKNVHLPLHRFDYEPYHAYRYTLLKLAFRSSGI